MSSNAQKPWVELILFIIPLFIIMIIFTFLGYLIAGVDIMGGQELMMKEVAIITLISAIGIMGLIAIFQRYFYHESLLHLGLSFENRTPDLVFGLILGFIAMGSGFFILLGLGEITYEMQAFDAINFFYMTLLFLVVAVYEEVLFRGFIQAKLMDSMNVYGALVLASLIFALFHAGNPNMTYIGFINLTIAGVLLGLSYVFTRNLWLPIGLHFGWNFFQSLFGFQVSGLDSYSIIHLSLEEHTVWNGGLFGFEGSILCTIIMFVLCGLILFYLHQRDEISV